MITFKQFLKESNVQSAWDVTHFPPPSFKDPSKDPEMVWYEFAKEKVIQEFGKERFDQLVKGKNVLFRGFKDSSPIGKISVIDSTNARRMSRDTNNIYQLMMARSQDLKHIPDRGNSFICSTDPEKADRFGKLYAVIPYPSVTDFGYVYADDMFEARIKMGDLAPQWDSISVETLSRLMGYVIHLVGGGDLQKNYRFDDADSLDIEFGNVTSDVMGMLWASCFRRPSTLELIASDRSLEGQDREAIADVAKMVRNIIDHQLFPRPAEAARIARAALKTLNKPEVQKIPKVDLIIRCAEAATKLHAKDPDAFFTNLSTKIFSRDDEHGSAVMHAKKISDIPENVECWFSGKCMVVDYMLIKD